MKKIFLLTFIILMFGIINVSASSESLGTFRQRECVTILQTGNCTYANITSIVSPDSTKALGTEIEMTQNGMEFTYDFCNTSQIGEYTVVGFGDLDGTQTNFIYDFEITPTGFTDTYGFYLLILGIAIGILVLGFYIKDPPIVILGSFALTLIGLYVLFYGISGLNDAVYTWAIGIIILMLGGYIGIRSGIELIGE